MPVHFDLGQGVAELSDGRACRIVDQHFFRPSLRRDVVDDRDALVEKVPATRLQVPPHFVAGDALPFETRDEFAGNRMEIPEEVGERLRRRLFHREHLDVPTTDLQVVSVALHGRIGDEVVDVRVVTQGGRIDDRFVVVHQLAEEPKRLRLRQLGQPDVVELDLECVRLVMKRSHRAIEVFVKKAQGLGWRQPVPEAGEGRFPQIADRCAGACACGRLVKEDDEQPDLEQFGSSAVQVRDALLDSLVRDGLRACGCADRWNRAFDDVLIDVPMLVKQSERCLQAVNDGGALGVRQAFVVDASQPVGDANVARLRQERRVIDEAPERNQAVDAAGVFVVPKDAFHA